MALSSLPSLLRDESAVAALLGGGADVAAVPEVARPLVIAALARLSSKRPLVIAAPTGTMAAQLADDLSLLLGRDAVAHFPAWETLPFERVSPAVDTMGRRLEVLWRLREESTMPTVVVAGVRALLQRLGPSATTFEPVQVARGAIIEPDALLERLSAMGYRREEIVEHRGEFARRGSIVDVFPATSDHPVRIDLWGDEVDRLTAFAVSDQRSTSDLDHVLVFPARELEVDDVVRERARRLVAEEPWGREHWERLAEGHVFDGMESWLPWLSDDEVLLTDLLPQSTRVVLIEPRRMRDRAGELLAEEDDLARALASSWSRDPDRGFPRLHAVPERLLDQVAGRTWSIVPTPDGPDAPNVRASGWAPIVGDPGPLIARLVELIGDGWRVVIAADGEGSAGRIAELLRSGGIDLPVLPHDGGPDPDLSRPGGSIVIAPIQRGCSLPDSRVALVAEADLTGRRRAHRRPRPRKREGTGVFDDFQPGSFVVHHQHGVGRFEGMVKRSIGGVERDYLLLAYKGGDKLYIPSDQIDAVRPYIGGEAPSLHRLGGADFAKAKARVRSAVQEVAQELVVLYQKRVTARGHAFGSDSPWQHEMESAFPFVETPDQRRAIEDTKADMERPYPMDRLVCGDVGFGKTEVAVRAAFKAIQDGKQVAVLVPTTLLASQHGNTFADRFAGYPVRVEVLSRFLTQKEANQVAAGLASGEVDCVIGTHRLLGEGIEFKNLGLLVIDEEQRFGVHHKEAIKQLRADVDVLTLTATPIPRTLEMSLVGIRDLSLLQTPPADRQPILTYVGEYDERVAVEAIRRELLREGQVFWVHNRVQSIEQAAARLRALVPEARVAVAHGQMDEGTLEQVVLDFWEGRFDVLVCTTIIESGIDMPTVNTLVVERADLLGLGQMHQLRGRVGRSGQRAYAYLFHPQDRVLTEEAYERLRTIGESTELGSGFRIAMRDLEIRGAGNLLGQAQSGHIAAVGYDLYCQMVTEAVAEMKGEPVREPAEIKLDVPVDAHLPSDYVTKEELRLEAYRRLATVTNDAEVDDIASEWTDRYGPVPPAAEELLVVARLRAECHRLGIRDVAINAAEPGRPGQARLAPIDLKASQIMRLERLAKGAKYKEDQRQIVVPVLRGASPAAQIVALLRDIVPKVPAERSGARPSDG
jgi:transcription-repair coupling factor (superfamily II helicase)